SEPQHLEITVADADAGLRLDRVVAKHCPQLSRTRVQELIAGGLVLLNGKTAKDSHKVHAGDAIEVVPQPRPALRAEAEAIPLDVLYEDEDVIALLGRGQSLSLPGDLLRPGIVHRLDKETSGILLVAKNDFAHARLAEAFRERAIQKIYVALVQGVLKEERGRIELAIARDPIRRTRMTAKRAALLHNAREARTDWQVLARIDFTTLLEVQLHTGRTHQIRVHFSALRHPVVGDTLYGAAGQLHIGRTTLPSLGRNFLHAAKIAFTQPRTGQPIRLTAPLPPELRAYLQKLTAAAGEPPERIDAALKGFL